MTRPTMNSAGVLLAVLSIATSSHAEVLLEVGVAPTIPTGSGEVTRFSAGLTVGAAINLPRRVALGLALRRFHEDGLSRALTSALVYVRSDFYRCERFSAFATMTAGPSAFSGCVASGACDAWGALMGLGMGLALPLSKQVRLRVALEPMVQVGMPDQSGLLFMPALTAGLTFWDGTGL